MIYDLSGNIVTTPEKKSVTNDMKGKIAIPRHVVINELRDRQFKGKSFENLHDAMDTALTLLGIDDLGRMQMKDVLQNARQDILAAEKNHLKVIKDDSTGIELDTQAMKDAMPDIIDATRARISQTLPSDAATTINESIDWEKFYCGYDYPILKFEIERCLDGTIIAQARYPNSSTGTVLSSDRYPQDGSPIPLENLYDDRWSRYLKGKSLVPISKKERGLKSD